MTLVIGRAYFGYTPDAKGFTWRVVKVSKPFGIEVISFVPVYPNGDGEIQTMSARKFGQAVAGLVHDPYRECPEKCNHDVARAFAVGAPARHEPHAPGEYGPDCGLLTCDGPNPPAHLIVNFGPARGVALDPPDAA